MAGSCGATNKMRLRVSSCSSRRRHMLSKEEDYLWARPALVANKLRTMEL